MTNINEVTPADAGEEYTPLKIKPDPNCKTCHGEGVVYDSVPWGMSSASMESLCDCVLEQIPEDQEDREVEIVKAIEEPCKHLSRVGDNYGESCADCGKQLSGYGCGGWFGRNLTEQTQCIHLFAKAGETDAGEVCVYCEEWRKKDD